MEIAHSKKQKIKKYISFVSLKRICVLFTGLLPFFCYIMLLVNGISLIANEKVGLAYVNTEESGLAVRMYAGTDSMLIDRLPKNSQVMVTGGAVDGSGKTWYEVEYYRTDTKRTGYVHSDYIKFYNDIAPAGEDQEFEGYLNDQGFPESYKAPLRVLHKQHPTWVFKSHKINLGWDYVLDGESKTGVNMIHTYYPLSWRSMEEGAYNWDKKEWIYLDTGCYGASASITAYFLDPRNGLANDSSIFQFEDLSYIPEMHNEQDTFSIVKGTFLAGEYEFTAEQDDNLYPSYGIIEGSQTDGTVSYKFSYTDTIMKAGEKAQVSPFFLASRMRQELGVNGTELSKGTYPGHEGYFNFFNIGAYAHSGRSARENGAIYAQQSGSYMRPWTNPYKAILGGADFLGSGYIRCEQNTLYLQKFDVTDGGNGRFSHQYMSNVNAPPDEAASMKRAYISSGVIETGAFVFDIPVYDNMTPTASVQPASDDNNATNNNWLSSISVSGGKFDNEFSRTVYEYTVTVPADTKSVNISAVPCDSGASIIGTGETALSENTSTHVITVLAPSFEIRTYTLTIVKSGQVQAPTPADPTPSSTAPAQSPSSAPATSAAVTSAPATSAPVTSAPATTVPATTAPATTAPATTAPATTAPATQSPTPTVTPVPDPKLSSDVYNIGTYITNIYEKTNITDFRKHLTLTDGSMQIIDSKGTLKSSGYIATGDVVQLYKGNKLFKSYPVVIYGDVSGHGMISLKDMVMVQRQLLSIETLDGPQFAAMDVTHDNKCSLADIVAIQRHLLGLGKIKQN